ncbi:cuticle protein 7-like [Aethina tumida]|uniref:cuticle protein 7-like n=1 Tax=Aethina tumida TaxID=116153 RepID=UPI0021475D36|nr:cuticle protein 7-like [Aethina tumida]
MRGVFQSDHHFNVHHNNSNMYSLQGLVFVTIFVVYVQCGIEDYHYIPIEAEAEEHHEHHEPVKYSFNYAVKDKHSGDDKAQYEERDGDQVKGYYMMKEADGTTRIVEYKADKHNGFQAVVHKVGEPKHEEYYEYDHKY